MKELKLPHSPIFSQSITMGSDPEFFFVKDGKVLGSEKIIPKEGLYTRPKNSYDSPETYRQQRFLVRDGIQAELNPVAASCRQSLNHIIQADFRRMNELLQLEKNGIKLSFDTTVKITKEEMESLSPESKLLGCMPSLNIYDEKLDVGITDPTTHLERWAGGHIHLGSETYEGMKKHIQNVKTMVPLLDLLVGNTCVLLDRNPGNKTRRKYYGRAGEYRLPKHGLEYRTLSNFWLKHPVLTSFTMSIARYATQIERSGLSKTFLDLVNQDDVRKAINTNSITLARKNFTKILPALRAVNLHLNSGMNYLNPYNKTTLKYFKHFVDKGINHWFGEDVLSNWNRYNGAGWETFLATRVAASWRREKLAKKEKTNTK